MVERDFSKVAVPQLKSIYRFQVKDSGASTMTEECRRLYLIQEVGAELQRRGVDIFEVA